MSHISDHLREDQLSDVLTRSQQAHVANCAACACRFADVNAVRDAIHDLPRTMPTAAATLALLSDVEAQGHSRGRRVRWLAASVAVAVIATGLLVWNTPGFGRQAMSETLAREIALDHLHYEHDKSKVEVGGSLDQIADFFSRTLQRRPRIAYLEATSIIGAKRCRIGGNWSALVWLERAGQGLSLFSIPRSVVQRRGCVRSTGINVCADTEPEGGSRVLAGNLPNGELLRLLDESMQ